MNENFCVVEHKSLWLLVYEPWWSKGLIHGMTLRPFSCDTSRWETAKYEVQRCLGLIDIFIPKQSHTTNIHDFRDISKEQFWDVIRGEQADAFVVPRKQSLSQGLVSLQQTVCHSLLRLPMILRSFMPVGEV